MATMQTRSSRIRQRPSLRERSFQGYNLTMRSAPSFVDLNFNLDCYKSGMQPSTTLLHSTMTRRQKRRPRNSPPIAFARNRNDVYWKTKLFLAIVCVATMMKSVSALDFVKVDSSTNIINLREIKKNSSRDMYTTENIYFENQNHKRKDYRTRNVKANAEHLQAISKQQKQNDKILATKRETEIYRVRGKLFGHSDISSTTSTTTSASVQKKGISEKKNDLNGKKLLPTMSKHESLSRGEHINAVQLPTEKISASNSQFSKRKLQREWGEQKDLSASKSDGALGKHPTAFSNDRPTSQPTASPTRRQTTLPPVTPTVQPTQRPPTPKPTLLPRMTPNPTPAPQRPAITLPPFTLPPFYSPTRFPTVRPTPELTRQPTRLPTSEPSQNPTRGPIANEPGPPTPVQEPGGGVIDPPQPGGGGPGQQITEPGGSTNDPTVSPTRPPTISPTSQPTEDPIQGPTFSPTTIPTFAPTQVPTASTPSPVDAPGPGEPGDGGNEPGPGQPGPGEPGGDEPGSGEPGGGVNEPGPGQPGGNEPGPGQPGGGVDEPGSGEPGSGGNEPGSGEPDVGGNEPKEPDGGGIESTSPPTATSPPTLSTQVPTLIEDEPGEPNAGGDQPGEPNGTGNQPGGGSNEPGEPGGNMDGPVVTPDSSPGAPLPAPGGENEPGGGASEPGGEPASVLGVEGEDEINEEMLSIPNTPSPTLVPTPPPITLTIAALNAANGNSQPQPSQTSEFAPQPTSEDGKVYSPGSPQWNKERISVAEVPAFELHFILNSKTKNLNPSLDDTNVLETLTANYILDYSNSMIGSNLLNVDNLMLQNIEVKGEIKTSSRRLLKSKQFGVQKPLVFTFHAKFVFMHWTKIAWALDLPGLAENLVKASLTEDEKKNFLTILQDISSQNNTDGTIEDFIFASATDVNLVKVPEMEPGVDYEINIVKETSSFITTEFPILSILAFSSLGLAMALCMVRLRIETKRQKWLKKGGEKCEKSWKNDEETVIFNVPCEDDDADENYIKISRRNTLQDNLKWVRDHGIYGDEEDQIWMQTSGKTATTVCLDEEVTVVFSDSSGEEDRAEDGPEKSQAKGLRKNLKWALDYLIYDDEEKEAKKKQTLKNFSKKSDLRRVEEAQKVHKTKVGELRNSTHHVSNLSLNTGRSRSMKESKNATKTHLEFKKSTHHGSNLTLNNTEEEKEKAKAYHKSNLPFYNNKRDLGESTHHASNLRAPKMIKKQEKGISSHHKSNLPLFTRKRHAKHKGRKPSGGYQSYSKRNRELEKDSQHVLSLTFQRRRDAIQGTSLGGDEYENLIARRGALEATTEHASNLRMNTRKLNAKR